MSEKKTERKPRRDNLPPGPGPGRPKGVRNKTTVSVKEAIESVYEAIGGHKRFAEWATDNLTEFYKIYSKLLPKDMNVSASFKIEDLLSELDA